MSAANYLMRISLFIIMLILTIWMLSIQEQYRLHRTYFPLKSFLFTGKKNLNNGFFFHKIFAIPFLIDRMNDECLILFPRIE